MSRKRWRAPDLTPEEAGALDAIEAIDWSGDDEAFRRRWAELASNPNWYEELKATWTTTGKRKARNNA